MTSPEMSPGDECEVVFLDVRSLVVADSPRLSGTDYAHVQALAEIDAAALPSILVHRDTRRVVDGAHRLKAAVLRGDETIAARYFQGSAEAAFLRAVEANIAHGLPLSRADREAAASRIVVLYPEWSDRAVAASVGLAAKTVAAIRQRATADLPQLHGRIGLDGRVRPLDVAQGRRRAVEVLRADPGASLRKIARAAGISPGTARDVRARLGRGEDPIPERLRRAGAPPATAEPGAVRQRLTAERLGPVDVVRHLRVLMADPSLLNSDSGRQILRWLRPRVLGIDEWAGFVDTVPPHSAYILAELARGCAATWREFAEELGQRAEVTDRGADLHDLTGG
jgi:ParB-like chromosome segregation protein Spo0J